MLEEEDSILAVGGDHIHRTPVAEAAEDSILREAADIPFDPLRLK